MGINSSSASSRQYQQLLSQFQILQQNEDEGLTYLEHRQTKQQYLLRQISCHDKEAFSHMQQILRHKMTQLDNNRHIVPLRKILSNSQDQYCMTFQKLYALFEFPQRTLDDEINERNLQKRRFQQKQLWSILASCILAMSHLQKVGIKHSALRSSTILISHDGIIQIYDPITTGAPTNYDNLLNHRSTPHIYLSPEQTEALREEKLHHNGQSSKGDIWTLGMIVLQAGLLSYQDDCYRDQCSRIHWQTLQYNLSLFQKYYTQQLASLVEFMLGQDQRSRPDWLELEEHVIKIEEDGRSSYSGDNHNNSQHKDPSLPLQGSIISAAVNKSFSQPIQKLSHQLVNRGEVTRVSTSKGGIKRSKVEHSNFKKQEPIQQKVPAIYGHLPNIILPIKTSDISKTRPLRNIFPTCSYTTQTKVDENVVMIAAEDAYIEDNNMNIINERQRYRGLLVTENNNRAVAQTSQNVHFAGIAATPNVYNQLHTYPQPPIRYPVSQNHQVMPQKSNSPHIQSTDFVVQQYAQGSRYQGSKLNGLKHGQGKFFYQDGGKYDGQWRHGKMQGFGRLYYQSDRIAYEGNWSSDQFSGKGILYNEYPETLTSSFDYRNFDEVQQFWTKYEGDFQQDMKSGWGVLYLSNGEFFEGQFKDDYADGQGTFITVRGEKIHGRWHCNIME